MYEKQERGLDRKTGQESGVQKSKLEIQKLQKKKNWRRNFRKNSWPQQIFPEK